MTHQKKKIEITIIEDGVILINGKKWYRFDHENVSIKKKLNSMDYKLDKLLKGGGTTDDSQKIQAIINRVDTIIEDIRKTV